MSICCGYLFFQRDTVYFLRLYFNPNWLEISPLEWPTQAETHPKSEGIDGVEPCTPSVTVGFAALLAAGEK